VEPPLDFGSRRIDAPFAMPQLLNHCHPVPRLRIRSVRRPVAFGPLAAALVAAALPLPVASSLASESLAPPDAIEGFLSRHCYDCHDDLVSEAGLDLISLDYDLGPEGAFSVWERVFHRVEDGEMPPHDRERPPAEEIKAFLATLSDPLLEADRRTVAERGRVHGRRLTRAEYEHAMQDLLSINVPLKDRLPEDEVFHGFETEAKRQQISHFHLDNYLETADFALEAAFRRAVGKEEAFSASYGPEDLARRSRGNYRGPENRGKEVRIWKMGLQFTGRLPATTVPDSGWYRIVVKDVRGINRGPDGATWGSLRSGAAASNEPLLYYIGNVEAKKEPRDLVFEAWIQKGHMLELKPNEGTDRNAPTGATGGNVGYEGRDLEEEGFAGIAYSAIEMERIHPRSPRAAVRRALFGDLPVKDGQPVAEDPEEALAPLLAAFARRAFRHPVSEAEVAPYLELAREALSESGGVLSAALKVGYRALLCSPRFLSFVEPVGELDDHALAARLGFFLGSSLPDDELSSLADAGRLRDPAVLAEQVERLLDDGKFERFVEHFSDQWLNLKQIDFTTPDRRRFPHFDPILQDSIVEETRRYFATLVREDLGVSHLVDSDFAIVNSRLATHYGIPHRLLDAGGGWQRVSLPEDAHGGLVTQASVLKVTADGSTTSPILRGIWINERLLGMRIAPPPPNVPAVEPDIRGAVSIRDELEKHRADMSCAACHIRIDPPGFALESFDPTGVWRDAYGPGRDAARVDPSGTTPEGEAFADIREWKAIYASRPELLARAFASQLIAYGTGAAPRFSDEPVLDKIVASTAESDYGLRSLIHAVVASPAFRRK